MRIVLLLCVVVVGAALGLESQEGFVAPAMNYHNERGIPLAQSIKEAEDALFASQAQDSIAKYHYGSRIVGGSVAPNNMYPYLAALLLSMTHTVNRSICGSVLLSTNRLVTAAHCWFDGSSQAWQAEVVLGSQFLYGSTGIRMITWNVIVHERWTPSNFENDVAMVSLPNHITFTPSIQPVALPTPISLSSQTFAGWWANAAGYGRIQDGVGVQADAQIRHVFLPVITNAQCEAVYSSQFIKSSTICTSGVGGIGVCQGDSGGPLVVVDHGTYFLVGVSSFVAGTGCQAGHPSAYARVTSFTDWILQRMW